ncbi:DUF3581 family protein [Thiomicrorhabdus indica]|uniref:DUF3581 family protein n=1 Tax=Thiomicrorhabdus indica TaxID=2267253 RepID=UPI00102D8DEF|nr:DUF3581 family protein [Thiomicrorhabdus indica]
MNLQNFYNSAVNKDAAPNQLDALHGIPNKISITANQGSRFAKEIAQDFNPLHNSDSKRFCVPGDLLFSLVLMRFGISQSMEFDYQGMVPDGAVLTFSEQANKFSVIDDAGKAFLCGQKSGQSLQNEKVIAGFCEAYVAFSGMSFPHILVPLMKQHGVMINPARPMVIYEKMAFEFERPIINLTQIPELVLEDALLTVEGKRGKVKIPFSIQLNERKIGQGFKTMTLSGLKPYDEDAVEKLIADYEASKQHYRT